MSEDMTTEEAARLDQQEEQEDRGLFFEIMGIFSSKLAIGIMVALIILLTMLQGILMGL